MLVAALLSAEAVPEKPWSLEDYRSKPPREVAARALEPIVADVWQRRTNVSLPSPLVSFTFFLTPRAATDGLCSSSTFTIALGFNTLDGGETYFKYLGSQPKTAGIGTVDHAATERACKALSTTSGFFLADSYGTALTAARRLTQIITQSQDRSSPPLNLTIEGPLTPGEARSLLARLSLNDVLRASLTGQNPPFDITIEFDEMRGQNGGANLSIVLSDEAHPGPIRVKYECCFVH